MWLWLNWGCFLVWGCVWLSRSWKHAPLATTSLCLGSELRPKNSDGESRGGDQLALPAFPFLFFFPGAMRKGSLFLCLVPCVFSINSPPHPDFSVSPKLELRPRKHGQECSTVWSPAVRISASPFDKGQRLQVTERVSMFLKWKANTSRSGRKIIDYSGGCLKMKTCGMGGGSVEKGLSCPAKMSLELNLQSFCLLCVVFALLSEIPGYSPPQGNS